MTDSNELAAASSVAPGPISSRLTVGQRLGYGIGDLGVNFYFGAAMTYLLFYYTDVVGLSAVVAGSVFLVARVVDAVTDPLMGIIADKTRTRWGKLRPYLLFGPIPLGLITVATFSTPDTGEAGKIVWAYATYITFGLLYTVVSIPYSALTAALTTDYRERTTLSTVRIGCAFVGSYIVSVFTMPLVGMFADQATGFFWTVSGYCVLATICVWIAFAATQERAVIVDEEAPVPTLRDCLSSLRGNTPLWVVIGVFTCGMMAFTVRFSAVAYYFKYNVGRPDLIDNYFGQTMPVMLLTLLIVPWFANRYGKAPMLIVAALTSIIGFVGLYLTPYDNITNIFLFSYLIAMGNAPIAVIGWAMVADTIEFAEHRQVMQGRPGVRADGTIYATASLAQKFAKAAGGAGVGFLLASAGYMANAAQSPQALEAILWTMTLIPASFMVVLIGVARLHRLDAHAHAEVVAALRAESGSS